MKKIACIGASLTEGYTANGNRFAPYTKRLQQRLTESLGVDDIHVSNFGRSGEETFEMLRRLPRILSQQKFDIVIILGGTNDVLNETPRETTLANLKEMCLLAISMNVMPFILSIPASTGPTVLMFKEKLLLAQHDLADSLQLLSKEIECVFVDVYHLTLSTVNTGQLSEAFADADGLHFTPKGYQMLGDIVYNAIMDWKKKQVLTHG